MGKEKDLEIIGSLWNDIKKLQRSIVTSYILISQSDPACKIEPQDLKPLCVVPYVDDRSIVTNFIVKKHFNVQSEFVNGIHTTVDHHWTFDRKSGVLVADGHLHHRLLEMFACITQPKFRNFLLSYYQHTESEKYDVEKAAALIKQMNEYLDINREALLISFKNKLSEFNKGLENQLRSKTTHP